MSNIQSRIPVYTSMSNETWKMRSGIRVLRFDVDDGVVTVRVRESENVLRLLYIPYDEFKALFNDELAFPV